MTLVSMMPSIPQPELSRRLGWQDLRRGRWLFLILFPYSKLPRTKGGGLGRGRQP